MRHCPFGVGVAFFISEKVDEELKKIIFVS